MTNKEELLEQYITEYSEHPEYRLGFCRLVRTKYRFENYKMTTKFEDIFPEDFIVHNPATLAKTDQVLQKGSCSIDEFKEFFNELEVDQILYIGI